jgi:hypothetical protein
VNVRDFERVDAVSEIISARVTAFFHVPKSAGTAVIHALAEGLRREFFFGFDRCLFGGFDAFDTLAPHLTPLIFGTGDVLPPTARLVGGHFAFSTIRRSYPEAQKCTVVREPVSRLLSQWLYWRQFSDDDLADWGRWAEHVVCSHRPLADFLSDPDVACQTDNMLVRMLLWPDNRIPNDGFIDSRHDEALLADAMAALHHFDFVDYVENRDLASNMTEWVGRPCWMKRLNETRCPIDRSPADLNEELTAEAHALLELRSRLDLNLWRAVVEQQSPMRDHRALRAWTLETAINRHRSVQGEPQLHSNSGGAYRRKVAAVG